MKISDKITYKNQQYSSLRALARALDMSHATLNQRLQKHGGDLDKALAMPLNHRMQDKRALVREPGKHKQAPDTGFLLAANRTHYSKWGDLCYQKI